MREINENYYLDEAGNVYSRPRAGTKGGRLKPFLNKAGYLVVVLSPVRVPVKVHRLMAEAFIPNPDNLPYVNHLDGNKENNHYSNLEWCTAQRNVQHAEELGLRLSRIGVKNPAAKLTEEDVISIRERYSPRCRINGARALARVFGVEKTTILRVVSRQDWKHIQ